MYIVIRRSMDGRLIGSITPFQHPSLKSAQAECKRLAGIIPNSTFYPMKALKGFKNQGVVKEPKLGTKYAQVFN